MNITVGSLVKVRRTKKPNTPLINVGRMGLVTDSLEDDTGFVSFEVVFSDDRGWYSDLELEIISESEAGEENCK